MANNKVRFTVDFPEKILNSLEDISEQEESTKAEVLRRAIALYAIVHREKDPENGTVIIKNGAIEKTIIL